MNALEIHSLTKTYPGFTLGPLDLTLPSGCILGLIGENGAGKSTTIKLILNMLHQNGGTITILGKDSRENVLARQDLGVVMDEQGIPPALNARQVGNIMKNIFRNWDMGAYVSYISALEIPEKKPFKDFSRGMKMKLGIAIALSHHPKLLLLDEATSGLDPVVRDQVVGMLEDFTRDENHTVLMSSHIVSDLERVCDYIAFLHKGKLMLYAEKDALLSQYGILRCTREALDGLDADAIVHRKDTPYGSEALVLRDAVPQGLEVGNVSIEELFVLMVKEEKK